MKKRFEQHSGFRTESNCIYFDAGVQSLCHQASTVKQFAESESVRNSTLAHI